jgi:hypothetical protein
LDPHVLVSHGDSWVLIHYAPRSPGAPSTIARSGLTLGQAGAA